MSDVDFSTIFTDVAAANDSLTEYQPDWFDGKKVDEVRFCREFLDEHPMICVKGSFFTVEGRMSVEIDKRRCGFKLTAPYSEERRRAIREAGKAKGIHTRLKKERGGARE